MKKIVIRAVEKPVYKEPDDIIRWFCEALGLTSGDQKSGIEVELLKRFLAAAANNTGISSSEIRLPSNVARTTVIYHINRFMESGLVVKKGRKYYLRAPELSTAIEEIEYDIEREMRRMLDTAKEFDRLFEGYYKKGKNVPVE
jgi:predicted transcriptional regulator